MAEGTELIRVETKAVVAREIDGLEMGVLEDGTPFLSSRALARLCGVVPSAILGWLPTLDGASDKPRDRKLREVLAAQSYAGPITIKHPNLNAHPDAVCMAVLEYYAFEAGPGITPQALAAYRFLARRSLREFIYSSVGYDPSNRVPQRWIQFHDRMMLNVVPRGYFSVFKEIADIVVSAIQQGLEVDAHTVPDISVGVSWGKHWEERGGDRLFGQRVKYPHKYPDYFPQSQVAIEAWIYPLSALSEFRVWMQEVYLPEKYPAYIKRKVNAGALAASRAELLLAAVVGNDEGELALTP